MERPTSNYGPSKADQNSESRMIAYVVKIAVSVSRIIVYGRVNGVNLLPFSDVLIQMLIEVSVISICNKQWA